MDINPIITSENDKLEWLAYKKNEGDFNAYKLEELTLKNNFRKKLWNEVRKYIIKSFVLINFYFASIRLVRVIKNIKKK